MRRPGEWNDGHKRSMGLDSVLFQTHQSLSGLVSAASAVGKEAIRGTGEKPVVSKGFEDPPPLRTKQYGLSSGAIKQVGGPTYVM
jgi:hypothetical protein